jgi:hypothetical protein
VYPLPRHLRVGAQAFSVADERFRDMPAHTRHADADVGNQRIASIDRGTTERHSDRYRHHFDIDLLALRQRAQRTAKKRGVAGGKKLLWIGSAAATGPRSLRVGLPGRASR